MTAILTLTRRKAGLPEAQMSLQAEVPSLHRAHLTMPGECQAFAEAFDSEPEVETVLVAHRPERTVHRRWAEGPHAAVDHLCRCRHDLASASAAL